MSLWLYDACLNPTQIPLTQNCLSELFSTILYHTAVNLHPPSSLPTARKRNVCNEFLSTHLLYSPGHTIKLNTLDFRSTNWPVTDPLRHNPHPLSLHNSSLKTHSNTTQQPENTGCLCGLNLPNFAPKRRCENAASSHTTLSSIRELVHTFSRSPPHHQLWNE